MRISQVTVEKLFGLFDHDIKLESNEHITILSGPNGFGKTKLLQMLAGFLQGRYGIFRRVPFECFRVTFEDGQCLELRRMTQQPGVQVGRKGETMEDGDPPSEPPVELILASLNGPGTYTYPVLPPRNVAYALGYLSAQISLQEFDTNLWRDEATGELLSADEFIDRYHDLLPPQPYRRSPPSWVMDILQNVSIRLIETRRLDMSEEELVNESRFKEGTYFYRGRPLRVVRYASDIVLQIRRTLATYGARSQELDRSFPNRLLEQALQALSAEELRTKLAELEDKRKYLTRLGFLTAEQVSPLLPAHDMEEKRDVLTTYVADVEAKLGVFDDMAAKVDLFARTINELFLYKTMRIDREEGLVFTSATGQRIDPSALSSGEQHQIVLLYELLFQCGPGSLVLVDEPEVSLHVAWQERFIDDLKKMVALSGFDVVVATHSVEIIGDHWDLVHELAHPTLAEGPEAVEQAR